MPTESSSSVASPGRAKSKESIYCTVILPSVGSIVVSSRSCTPNIAPYGTRLGLSMQKVLANSEIACDPNQQLEHHPTSLACSRPDPAHAAYRLGFRHGMDPSPIVQVMASWWTFSSAQSATGLYCFLSHSPSVVNRASLDDGSVQCPL